jgi:hypothetical protein
MCDPGRNRTCGHRFIRLLVIVIKSVNTAYYHIVDFLFQVAVPFFVIISCSLKFIMPMKLLLINYVIIITKYVV